ncbi:MAG: glycosyltransferase family 4 protein [Actinomycetota bacterium]|nr:glycosyltransferase family 4 protein [Actinomycetota bacterium]
MPGPAPDEPLRVALLAYRGNPFSGGQGVYVHHLSRELTALGHHVEVWSGPPYPPLDPGIPLVRVPSLDLYRSPDPFRTPALREFRDVVDVAEFALMCSAGFPEPLTFSLRAWRGLRRRRDDFDLVHDNQCLGYGILGIDHDVAPVVATLHHPITVDRDLELAHAPSWQRRLSVRRWYGFVRMQKRVVRRLPHLITVSSSSARDICTQMGARSEQLAVVPVGVDTTHYRPLPEVGRVPGRIMTTASADVPLKGLLPLIEAVAKVRTERHAELVVVGQQRQGSDVPAAIVRLGLEGAVRLEGAVDDRRMVELYAEAEVAVVPSLYEGFSLPAIEAMACGVPLVATTGGALPEVVGNDGDTALLVPPADPGALAAAIGCLLDDADRRARVGAAGRARVLDRFTWQATARDTVTQYRRALADARGGMADATRGRVDTSAAPSC